MKKYLALMLLVLFAFVLVGCGKNKQEVLYIYNWTYYIADDTVKNFEKLYNCKVVYDMYSSNEEMYAKLKAGGTGYDIVFPSGDFVKIMIKQGMLEPIDKARIANFKNIDPLIISEIAFDPGNAYSVPYFMGLAGISVNKEKVPNFERSSSIFSRTDLKGRMTILDDMRDAMGLALKNLGYSVNTTDDKQLAEAKALLLKWKANILKFDTDTISKAFATGDFWVVHAFAENILTELDDTMKAKTEFFIPKEGAPMYIDSLCILKDAKHKDLAYKFINYIHEPAVYAQIADFLKYPAINTEARKLVVNKPNYQISDLVNCEFKEDLGPDVEKYNKIWQEIRM